MEPGDFSSHSSPFPMVIGIGGFVAILVISICCCFCPCCCLYQICRKPQPMTTNTTVVTTTPQQHPPPPIASPGLRQHYQGVQYPPYQPVPVQPAYGSQPIPTMPYQGQSFTPGPPPAYHEAIGPAYPPNPMPYSQAAFSPGQLQYQPNAPPAQPDYLAQPAYNPDFVAAPPMTG